MEKVQTLLLTTDQVFSTLATYLGSSYVDQFNKFGRVFQIYVQGDAPFRMSPDDILHFKVRNQNGDMIPLGTVLTITPIVGPSLISLYNLYPSASIVGVPAKGFSSGDAISLMEQIAARTLPPGVGYSWTALSYQEKLVGGQIVYVMALAMLLVYLVSPGSTRVGTRRSRCCCRCHCRSWDRHWSCWCFVSTKISTSRSAWCCSSPFRPRMQF